MQYQRPKSNARLTMLEKTELMRGYVEFYREKYAKDSRTLNCKIPREALAKITDAVGSLLLERTAQLVATDGPVSDFLKKNPLPASMRNLLSPETRAFCLALNALKQWVSAEQAAVDRLILGGQARKICRAVTSNCLITGQLLDRATLNLHHPIRDGRPPLPLSKEGHSRIEKQTPSNGRNQKNSPAEDDKVEAILLKLKHEGNRSWVQLRNGCLDLVGNAVIHSTKNVGANSRTFARKAKEATGLGFEQLLQWLDQNKK